MEAVPIVAGAATSPGGERGTRVFKVTRGSRWHGKNVPIVAGGATSPGGPTKVMQGGTRVFGHNMAEADYTGRLGQSKVFLGNMMVQVGWKKLFPS